MSGPVQAPAEQTPPAAQNALVAQPPVVPATATRTPAIFGAVGLVLTLATAGFVLVRSDFGSPSGDAARPTLNFVAQRDIGAAAATLTPSAAAALVEDAQRCQVPLVSMLIEKGTAPIGSTIRIRSGNYVSPYFAITEGTQRVAVPYPAPYGAGNGTMVIEGSANGAIVGFTPVTKMIDLPGTQSIPVVWRPVNPC